MSPLTFSFAFGRLKVRLLHADPVIRHLAWITLVNSIGTGLFMTMSPLFFTRVLGLTVAQVGFGLTVAGCCGVASSMPAGWAADRWGSKRVLNILLLSQAVGMAAYPLVRGFPSFLVLASIVTALDRGAASVRSTLYSDALSKSTRVAGRAYLRAVTNGALGIGATLAALALVVDASRAYTAAVFVNAISFVAVAAMLVRVPVVRRPTHTGLTADYESRRGALRDWPYLTVTILNGLMALQFAVIEVGLPLWIVQDTDAPAAMAAATLVVNTVLVMAFQVRASRGSGTPRAAARVYGKAGMLLSVSCLVLAFPFEFSVLITAALVLMAAVLQAMGEVFSQAGGWALSYDLADHRAQGTYQGVFNAGSAAALMMGPVLVSLTALRYGAAGWVILAVLFAVSGVAMAPAVRWAERTRSRYGIAVDYR